MIEPNHLVDGSALAAKKAVASCDKPGVAASQALNPGSLNYTPFIVVYVKRGEPKYPSTRRRRKHIAMPLVTRVNAAQGKPNLYMQI